MSTEEKIDRLNRFLKQQKDQRFLNMMLAMMDAYNDNQPDWWDELSEGERKSIEIGLEQAERGEVVSYEEVQQKIKAKLGI